MEKPTSYTFRVFNDPAIPPVPTQRLEGALRDLVTKAKLPFGLYILRIERIRTAEDTTSPSSAIQILKALYIGSYRCVMQLSRAKHDTYIGSVTVPHHAVSGTLHEALMNAGASLTDTDWGERVTEQAVATVNATAVTHSPILERKKPIDLTGSARAIANAAMMQYAPGAKKNGEERVVELAPTPPTKTPPDTTVPLPQATVAASALPSLSLTEQATPAPTKGARARKHAEKCASPKTRRQATVRQPSLLSRLSMLERTVKKERAIAKKELVAAAAKLASLDSLVAELKKKKAGLKQDRLLRNRLKKMR